jgi:hypothetical protein
MATAPTALKTSLPGSEYWYKVEDLTDVLYCGIFGTDKHVTRDSTPEDNGYDVAEMLRDMADA